MNDWWENITKAKKIYFNVATIHKVPRHNLRHLLDSLYIAMGRVCITGILQGLVQCGDIANNTILLESSFEIYIESH